MTYTEPTIDAPRLRKELEFITNNPERWNQRTWWRETECGTVGCLAGNTVSNAGYTFVQTSITSERSKFYVKHPTTRRVMTVPDAARRLFGLTQLQADVLFSSSMTLRQLWQCAAAWTNGEITIPVDLVDPD